MPYALQYVGEGERPPRATGARTDDPRARDARGGVQAAISGKFCTLGAVPRLYMYSTYLIRYTVRS